MKKNNINNLKFHYVTIPEFEYKKCAKDDFEKLSRIVSDVNNWESCYLFGTDMPDYDRSKTVLIFKKND